MRYAVHQVLIELASEALVIGNGGSLRLFIRVENRRFAVDDLVDQFLGLVDAVGYLCGDNGLAVKARGLNALVRRDDDAVAGGDLSGCKHVLRTAGAVGFYLDGDAQLVARLGKRLGSHVGVSDTCGAGGHSQNPEAFLGRSGSSRLLRELLGFLIVDDLKEFRRRFCRLELRGEVLVHKHLHQTRQHLEVDVAVGSGSYHKDKLAGRAVRRFIVNAAGNGDGGKSRSLDRFALGMRNSDLHADSGGAHVLTGKYAFLVSRCVFQVSALLMQRHKDVDCLSLAFR